MGVFSNLLLGNGFIGSLDMPTTWFLISYAIDVFLSTKKDKILVSKDSKL